IRIEQDGAAAERVQREVMEQESRALAEEKRDAVPMSVARAGIDRLVLLGQGQRLRPGVFLALRMIGALRHRRPAVGDICRVLGGGTFERLIKRAELQRISEIALHDASPEVLSVLLQRAPGVCAELVLPLLVKVAAAQGRLERRRIDSIEHESLLLQRL